MDEKSNPSAAEEGPVAGDRERSESADRLVARLAELRGQLEAIAPPDQVRARQALERIQAAYERIESLDTMLEAAREREHGLTVQLVRDRKKISEYEARVSELGTIAARVVQAEEARREAETAALERERGLAVAEADAAALRTERDRLRSRCAELESDLGAVSDEIASAAIARTEASRLERERNEARERAHGERKLAAADRIRAAEAELRATELQGRLRTAERRIVQLTNRVRDEAPEVVTGSEKQETTSEPPWLELQRTTQDPETSAADQAELPLDLPEEPERSAEPEPDVIDLREDDRTTGGDAPPNGTDRGPEETEASPGGDSLLSRLIHQRRRQ